MFATTLRRVGVLWGLGAVLLSSSAVAAPQGSTVFTRALYNASRESSVLMAGSAQLPGSLITLHDDITTKGSAGTSTISGLGSEQVADPVAGPLVVRASSRLVLAAVLIVRAPRASEVNVWYRVPASDPRFHALAGTYGPLALAQFFSFSPEGWSRHAVDEGVAVLRGVKVVKLLTASNAFSPGKGFEATTLYVTDNAHPLPFAMTFSPTTGLFFFRAWGHSTLRFARSTTNLPH